MKCGAKMITDSSESAPDPLRSALVNALGAQYEVMRLLGRGGMGAVYLARETALDRLVAVKVLPPDASDEQSRERFKREARTAAKLNHPNIVPLHSFGDSDGMMYFVMGFVQGESLADRMKRVGKMTESQSRRILAEVADALSYAHSQHVVHRDIKPDNILIEDATGKPMLTDFGIAKAQVGGSTLTAIGSIVGTPHYMSPEQASGDRDLDGRSDLYSLGIVAYRMLAGNLPFDGESLQDIIVQHVTKEAPPLRDVAAEISEHAARAIGKCLAKAPEDRWRDAGEFRAAIREEGSTEANLPLALRMAEGMVAKSSLMLSVGILAMPILYLWESSFLQMAIAVTVGASIGLPLGWSRIRRVGKEKGYSVAELKTIVLRPPKWWPFGWPKKWRRPDDVHDRLIPEIRRLKQLFGWGGTTGAILIYCSFLVWSLEGPLAETGLREALFAAALLLWGGGGLTLGVRARALAKRLGVDPAEMSQALNTHTARTDIWRSPELSKFLLDAPPQEGRRKLREPQTHNDFVESIREVEQELDGADRDLAADALSAARQLVTSIESVEKEIDRVSSQVDEAEIAKLEARLEALGTPDSSKDDFDADMRALLQNQLTLHRRMVERLESARERHARMNELLKLLWLRVSDLRAQQSQEAHDATEITGKIRTLCEDIGRHVAATEETVKVIAPVEPGE